MTAWARYLFSDAGQQVGHAITAHDVSDALSSPTISMPTPDDKSTDQPADDQAAAAASDSPVIPRIVDRRLIRNLLRNSVSTLLFGMLAGFIFAYAVWRTTGQVTIGYWLAVIVVVTAVRLAMTPVLRHHLNDHNTHRIGTVYAVSALINGATWAAVALFDDATHDIGTRLMILVTLVGMPIAAMSSTALYRPVFYAFSSPIFLSMIAWSWWQIGDLAIEFTLLFTAYAVLIFILANRYNGTLRTSLMRDIENELLLHEVNSMNERLHKLAYQDSLTGLSNRRSFEETTARLLTRRREDEIVALMLIDMDKFKWINDTLGHAAGDTALVELAQRIEDNSRLRDLVTHTQMGAARIGGDEFVALYHLGAETDVEPIAIRILGALMRPMRFGDQEFQPSVSIGIAVAPLHGDDFDGLLGAADAAMYQAKQDGGGRFVVATVPGDDPLPSDAVANAQG